MYRINDKYYLDTDPYNFIIKKKKTSEKGSVTYNSVAYYHSLDGVAKHLLREHIREDVDNIAQLRKDIDKISETLFSKLKNVVRKIAL